MAGANKSFSLFFHFCFAFRFYYYNFDIFFDDVSEGIVEGIFCIYFDDVAGGATVITDYDTKETEANKRQV